VSTLIAPAVRRALVAVSFNSLATAAPSRLKRRTRTTTADADAFHFSRLVVMRDAARALVILDVRESAVAADAVEYGRRRKERKEGHKSAKRGFRGIWKVEERVFVQSLCRDGADKRGKVLGEKCRWAVHHSVYRHRGVRYYHW
jgi:hypothetical protein